MPWVEISEASFTLGVSERTIRNWIKSGKMQARTVNGRREVEIPDSEPGGASAHAFVDDEDDSQPLGAQKRLEVALIECGRVKGTLASQERMMENLSANIQELNAKLQKSERVIAKRTIYIVIAVCLGLVLWLATKAMSESDKSNLITKHNNEIVAKQDQARLEQDNLRTELQKDKQSAVDATRTEMNATHAAELDRLAKRHDEELARVQKKLDEREIEIKRLNEEAAQLKAKFDSLQQDLAAADKHREENSDMIELQKKQLGEIEKSRSQLEAELAKWKAHYHTPPPE